MTADIGARQESGRDIGARQFNDQGVVLTAETVSFSLTGFDAGLTVSRTLTAENGFFSITGFPVDLVKIVDLQAETGFFSLTGFDAHLTVSRTLTAETGFFSITGFPVDLVYSNGIIINRVVELPGVFTDSHDLPGIYRGE